MNTRKILDLKIGFVSFADGNRSVISAGKRLRRQISRSGISSQTKIYDENLISGLLNSNDKLFLSNNRKNRGFGFWIWKPLIILDFIKENPSLDVIVYLDAGCEFHYSKKSQHNFIKYIDSALVSGVCAFSTQSDIMYTKKFTIDKFNISKKDISEPQIQSGILIFNSVDGQRICQNWIMLMRSNNYQNLLDKNDDLIEYPEFVEHRHDQSILSMYLKAKKIGKAYPCASHTWPSIENGLLKFSPFWAVRNMSFLSVKVQKIYNPIFLVLKVFSYILKTIHSFK